LSSQTNPTLDKALIPFAVLGMLLSNLKNNADR
jgi:hypothetical protein